MNGTDLVLFKELWRRKKTSHNIANAFFRATPQHPLIEEKLKQILNHVQVSHYGNRPTDAVGPGLLYNIFQNAKAKGLVEEKHFAGLYHWPDQTFETKNGEVLVLHKCENCSMTQDWSTGNNCNRLHEQRQFCCQDAASLFQNITEAYA